MLDLKGLITPVNLKKKKIEWIFLWTSLLVGMKNIPSAVWVTQRITSKAAGLQASPRIPHLEKAVDAKSCRQLLQGNPFSNFSPWDLFCIFFFGSYQNLPTSN